MKKNLIYIQILLWSFVALVGISVLGYAIYAEASGEDIDFNVEAVSNLGNFEYTYQYNGGKYKELDINLVSQDITVVASDTDEILIRHYTNKKISNKDMLEIKTVGKRLEIGKKKKWQFFNIVDTLRESVVIELPKNQLYELDIEVVSADIKFEDKDIILEKIDLTSVSGTIKFKEAYSKEIKLETVSGDMEGYISQCDHLKINTVSGSSEIQVEELPKEIDFESVSGDFEVQVLKDSGFEIDFESVSGNLKTDFPITFSERSKTDLRGQYGDGFSELDIETVSGDASLIK